MQVTRCPHCGKAANPLRFLVYTKWTGYRCTGCRKPSRFDSRSLATAGGLGVASGALVQGLYDLHGVARVAVILGLTLVFVAGMALFMTLRPVEK